MTLKGDIAVQNKDKKFKKKPLEILLNCGLNKPQLNIFSLLGIDLPCEKGKKNYDFEGIPYFNFEHWERVGKSISKFDIYQK